MIIFDLIALIAGIALVSYSSEKTVVYSTHIASSLGVPTLVVGVLLVAIGTDLPEIANSIFSSYAGHGDVNVGNALGSCLTQISLMLGIAALMGGAIYAHRRNVLVLGLGAVVAVVIATVLLVDGRISRIDALILIISYMALLWISIKFSVKEFGSEIIDLSCMKNQKSLCIIYLLISIVGVIISALLVVNSAVNLAQEIGLPEYIISFFIIGAGTSLPELSVAIAAIKKKQYGIVIGDIFGSNIIDATLALGIGPLLFPGNVSAEIILPLAIYVIIASAVIVGIYIWRGKIDKYEAIALIALYFLAFWFI